MLDHPPCSGWFVNKMKGPHCLLSKHLPMRCVSVRIILFEWLRCKLSDSRRAKLTALETTLPRLSTRVLMFHGV